ncbi:hypothetical protein [Rhodococcus gordoniae]|uniref:hypothetical protein n=1 Tax=Rhodococcus gordoniae TaxID=223392 RepID=UPI0020CC5FC7|nr:hypothetical protein [Rhodococcus gordoniae]UTT49887.1 hypothetical protein NMQ04_06775 [Rhodococcus gordoniae]
MNELARTIGAAVAPVERKPGTDLAVCLEPEGLLVCGDQNAVAKYVTELRGLASDVIDTANVSPVVAAHASAIAAAGLAISSQAGEFVRLSSETVEALKTARALPVGNGFFRGTLVGNTGKFTHQVQWQHVSMAPARMATVQLLAVQVALASAIASVEKSIARVEGKVDRVLALAEASRAGDVRGHYVVLSRLTAQLDERQILTNTDWESVAGLGPDLVVTIERLREHAKRTLAGFDPTKPINERADYLRKALEDNRLGETLHLLVVSEQSLYLWQRLRIARVQATEPDHLQIVLDDARGLLADNAEQDGMLLHHAREHLSGYARMDRLDGFRWGATHNLSHDIVHLRNDLDGFAEARGRQVTEWVEAEKPNVGDALAEVGSRALAAGSVAGRALGAGLSGVGSGLRVVGRGIGQLVGGSRPDTEDKVRIEEWITPDDLGTTGALYDHVRDGRMRVGDTLRYQDAATGLTYTAKVTSTGQLGFDGHEYDDPSAPLIEKCGRTRNGWRDWRLADGRSLRDLGVQAHSS